MYNLKNINFTTVYTAWSESHLRSHFPPRLSRAHGDHFGFCHPHEPWLIMKLGLHASLSSPVQQWLFFPPGNVFQPTAVTFDYCFLLLPFLFPSTFVFKVFMVVASSIICLHLLFLIDLKKRINSEILHVRNLAHILSTPIPKLVFLFSCLHLWFLNINIWNSVSSATDWH